MSDYLGDIIEDDTIRTTFTTSVNGVPTVLAGTPVVSIYEDSTATALTAGVTLVVDFDSVVGLNHLTLVLTDAAYEAGKDYSVVITTGTVGGASVVGHVVAQFSLENRFMRGTNSVVLSGPTKAEMDTGHGLLATPAQVATELGTYDGPTRAEATSDKDAILAVLPAVAPIEGTSDSGTTTTMVDAARTEIDDFWNGGWILFTDGTLNGVVRLVTDFDAVANTMTLSPATVAAVATHTYRMIPAAHVAEVLALTGHTVQTGDSFARIGADGAGLTAINLPNQTMDIIGDITGNLSGSVGSVTGNVGGDVQGNVDGTVAVVTTNTDMRGTDSAALASVLGALDDAAAADDPTAADTAVQYLKQLVNLLAGTAGIGTMPTGVDPANGVNLFEMLRAAMGSSFATATDSLEQLQADHVAIQTTADNVETQIGTAGAGLGDLGGMSDAMKAEIEAEVNDALDTAIAELGVAQPATTPTIRTAIMLLYMALRNNTIVQTSGTDALEIHNNAGTKIASKALTDDGSDYDEAKMISG